MICVHSPRGWFATYPYRLGRELGDPVLPRTLCDWSPAWAKRAVPLSGRERPSPAVGGEMLVVLRGYPVTAPLPADRDERPPDRVAVPDHRPAVPGPVGPCRGGGRVDGAAGDVGVLERVDVDRQPVGVLGP